MKQASLSSISSQQAQLSGRLDRLVGKDLIEQGRKLIVVSNKQWQVDLSGITHSSSVGIAILLDWIRYGKRKNIQIEFINIPLKMKQVIEFSGLNDVFGLK